MIRKGWDWVKRHKGKAIALSTIVAVGAAAAAYFAYTTSNSDASDAPQGSEDKGNDGSSSLGGGGGANVDGGNSSSSNISSNNSSGDVDADGGGGGRDKNDAKVGGTRVIRDGKGSENSNSSNSSSSSSSNNNSSSIVAARPDRMFPDISLIERTKWRLKARKQFDSIICPFLGILVVKISDTLNTKAIVMEIKQIKAYLNSQGAEQERGGENSEGSDEDAEADDDSVEQLLQIDTLWDRLKVSSISILVANAFLSSTLAVLIQIQMYIISKYAYFLSQNSSSGVNINSNNSGASREAAGEEGLGDEAIRILMECTYGHFLKSGLETAINIINQHVASCFSEWSINTSLEVEFSDLRHSILLVKKSLEGNFDSFLKVILQDKGSSTMGMPPDSQSGNGSNSKVLKVDKIMNQTWEIVDSPLFVAAVKEATDIYFQIFFDQLKKSAFIKDEKMDSTFSNLKKIPLASLLSRIQSISTNMIPTDTATASTISKSSGSSHNSNSNTNLLVLKDIMSGPILDSLCISVFEASALID